MIILPTGLLSISISKKTLGNASPVFVRIIIRMEAGVQREMEKCFQHGCIFLGRVNFVQIRTFIGDRYLSVFAGGTKVV